MNPYSSTKNFNEVKRLASTLSNEIAIFLLQRNTKFDQESQKYKTLLCSALQKPLILTLSLSMYAEEARRRIGKYDSECDNIQATCIYSTLEELTMASRDNQNFWLSLYGLIENHISLSSCVNASSSSRSSKFTAIDYHNTFGSELYKFNTLKPFKSLYVIKKLFLIEKSLNKLCIRALKFLTLLSTRITYLNIYWLSFIPRQHEYITLIPFLKHKIIKEYDCVNNDEVNYSVRTDLVSLVKHNKEFKACEILSIDQICAAVSILPVAFLENIILNCELGFDYYTKYFESKKVKSVFSCGSSLFTKKVFSEAVIKSLGINNICIQHGSCGGYTYSSWLIKWTTIEASTCFATNYKKIYEVDPETKQKNCFAVPSFQFLFTSKSIAYSFLKRANLDDNKSPKILIALGAIYRFNPLNECFYSFNNLNEYTKKILELVECLTSSNASLTIRDYDSASTEANLDLYTRLESIESVSSIYATPSSDITAIEMAINYDFVITDVVSGLFSECSAVKIPVYTYLTENSQLDYLSKTHKQISSLVSNSIVTSNARELCKALMNEFLSRALMKRNKTLRLEFCKTYNCADIDPTLPSWIKLPMAISEWAYFLRQFSLRSNY